ncbi:MAG: hypothetical protein ACLUD2_10480 [Clostridium sp.]
MGVSPSPGLRSPKEMVATMNNGIVFAMANPDPEIMPGRGCWRAARRWSAPGAPTSRTRSNNVLVFPGVFKGVPSPCARRRSPRPMKERAAYAIASLIPDDQLTAERLSLLPRLIRPWLT